ncbi:hypothetical protein [Brevundimonas sp.]|uniref:hypothetical protein n=1 Tax=Brevundimonas sp. TaxID=1871086 RepID=UPI002D3F1422|nr:hypothetical protein [Brevundimonas sp.]HYD26948.1 hypothetical protein [Brevundimonas sp.]
MTKTSDRRGALKSVFQASLGVATLGLLGTAAAAQEARRPFKPPTGTGPYDPFGPGGEGPPWLQGWLRKAKGNPQMQGDFLVRVGQGMQRGNTEAVIQKFAAENGGAGGENRGMKWPWKKVVAIILRAVAEWLDP